MMRHCRKCIHRRQYGHCGRCSHCRTCPAARSARAKVRQEYRLRQRRERRRQHKRDVLWIHIQRVEQERNDMWKLNLQANTMLDALCHALKRANNRIAHLEENERRYQRMLVESA